MMSALTTSFLILSTLLGGVLSQAPLEPTSNISISYGIRIETNIQQMECFLSGPSDRWFGVGFGSNIQFADVIVYTSGPLGTNDPLFLYDYHFSGETAIKDTEQNWHITENSVNGTIRTIVAFRIFNSADKFYSIFNTTTQTPVPVIFGWSEQSDDYVLNASTSSWTFATITTTTTYMPSISPTVVPTIIAGNGSAHPTTSGGVTTHHPTNSSTNLLYIPAFNITEHVPYHIYVTLMTSEPFDIQNFQQNVDSFLQTFEQKITTKGNQLLSTPFVIDFYGDYDTEHFMMHGNEKMVMPKVTHMPSMDTHMPSMDTHNGHNMSGGQDVMTPFSITLHAECVGKDECLDILKNITQAAFSSLVHDALNSTSLSNFTFDVKSAHVVIDKTRYVAFEHLTGEHHSEIQFGASVNPQNHTISVRIIGPSDRWFGVGFGEQMNGSDVILYTMGNQSQSEPLAVYDYHVTSKTVQGLEKDVSQNWTILFVETEQNETDILVIRPFYDGEDKYTRIFDPMREEIDIIWAHNNNPDYYLAYHGPEHRGHHIKVNYHLNPFFPLTQLTDVATNNVTDIWCGAEIDPFHDLLAVRIVAPPNRWFGISFGKELTSGDMIIYGDYNNTVGVWDAYINGSLQQRRRRLPEGQDLTQQVYVDINQDWIVVYSDTNATATDILVVRPLNTSDANDLFLDKDMTDLHLYVAYDQILEGTNISSLNIPTDNITFLDVGTLAFISLPFVDVNTPTPTNPTLNPNDDVLSVDNASVKRTLYLTHGILMAVAWMAFIPCGIMAALLRWCCIFRWFMVHQILITLGVLTTIAGFIVSTIMTERLHHKHFNDFHRIGGLILTILSLFLMCAGCFLCCRRKTSNGFEFWGLILWAFAQVLIVFGIFKANMNILIIPWAVITGVWLLSFALLACVASRKMKDRRDDDHNKHHKHQPVATSEAGYGGYPHKHHAVPAAAGAGVGVGAAGTGHKRGLFGRRNNHNNNMTAPSYTADESEHLRAVGGNGGGVPAHDNVNRKMSSSISGTSSSHGAPHAGHAGHHPHHNKHDDDL